MYTFDSKVRYSEVNAAGKLSIHSIVNYFQDCSTFQSEELGVGVSAMQESHQAWVLNAWQIVLADPPSLCDEITIGTWASDFKGCYGYRNFLMQDRQGQPLAYANSIWVLVDTESGRPVKCPPELAAIYPMDPPYPMEQAPRKIKVPEIMTSLDSFPVTASHIDTNHHVNNCAYVQMATDLLPEDFHYQQLRVEYRNSALPGETITPSIAITDNCCTVVLEADDGRVYAVLEFSTPTNR